MKKLILIVGAILLIILFPLFTNNMYHLYLMNRALIHAILATGLVFLTGFAGQISLGQAGFYAIGAYTSAYFTVRLGLPIPIGVIAGVVLSVVAGFLLSIPSFKLKAFFLSLVTIAFGQIVWMLVINLTPITGGPYGFFGIPFYSVGNNMLSYGQVFWLFGGILLVSVFIMYRIKHSHFGRAMLAMNDDDVATETCGISTKKLKIAAFGFSAGLAGLAGALYAHLAGFLSPEPFTFFESSNFVAMAVVGGLRHMSGGVVGGIGLTLLPEFLRFGGWENYYLMVTSLIVIVIIIFVPMGLGPILENLFRKVFKLKRSNTKTL
ncbi:branched-chain amino acid ABC transporter permease [Mesotoga sp. SC_3PWM13N19]|jgi:branched-chain amino acid transport system permease protein|uniref:branched-chain amino acid ABC transporter permease n=1 Tax=unclassified Mesotoga TaxID=1184398 RepID=UPI000A740100|nr:MULTISPECIES: branched-chain amino acid ABC transporter permease [unclassified Mesotoga]MDD3459929.1 branched-chain amino acid ABC transporter permease [Mesotoga sp.]RAM58873.1 branched-chain amino acid ABC transporter permease [Mesotoga sp. SC_3PWM13N19]